MMQVAPQPVSGRALADRVEAVFARIAAGRMAGLPVCNPHLHVEVPMLILWQGQWLGVLITPWTMAVLILPGDRKGFVQLAGGHTQTWRFPSGEYAFIGNHEPDLGDYQLCSLYSPMFEFDTQHDAREVALAALAGLFLQDAGNILADRPTAPRDDSVGTATARRGFLRRLLPGLRA